MRIPLALALLLTFPLASQAAPIRVTGAVSNWGGEIPAGIRVELFPAWEENDQALARLKEGRSEPAPLARARAAADGTFEILAPGAGAYRLRVEAEGIVPMEHLLLSLVEEAGLLELPLPEAEPMTVRVLGPDGRPAAGIGLQIDAPATIEDLAPPSWWPAARRGISGPDGRLRLPRHTERELPALTATSPHVLGQTGGGGLESEVTFRLRADKPFRVEVRGADGNPVAGAVIRRRGWPVAATGPDGSVEIALPEEGALVVEGPDGGRARLVRPQTGRAVSVRLEPPRWITGKVTDALSGRPIAGAVVWAGRPPVAPAVRSDAGGAFRFALPAGEEPRLEAAAAGYLSLTKQPVSPGGTVLLKMDPSAAVSGVVVDRAGRPVPGARIETDAIRGEAAAALDVLAQSGPDGGFRLTGLLPAASYGLRVSREGFVRKTALAETAPPGQATPPLRIVLETGQTAIGRVVSEAGQPVAGAMVVLVDASVGVGKRDETDAEGKYEIRTLSPGAHQLIAVHPEHTRALVPDVDIPAGQAVTDLGELVLAPGAAIEGRLVDARGNPVQGAELYLSPSVHNSETEGALIHDIESGADGTFRIPTLRKETRYDLMVYHPKYLQAKVSGIEAPTREPLRVVMRSGRSLSGRVVGPGGEPVALAVLSQVEASRIGNQDSRSETQLTATDAEGRFQAGPVEPGLLTLSVSAKGFVSRTLEGLQIPEDRDLEDLRIVLDRALPLDVRVVTAQGEPVAGATVQANPESEEGLRRVVGDHTGMGWTDEQGRTRIFLPKPGIYELTATLEAVTATTAVEAGPGAPLAEIRLPAGVEISGRVVGEDGVPAGNAMVEIIRTDQGSSSLPAGPDGAFRIPHVQDGEYRLRAQHPLSGDSSPMLEITVAGQPVRGLELRLQEGGAGTLLTGRILGLEPDELREVIMIGASPAEGGTVHSGQVNAQGIYEIRDLPPGEWYVSVHLQTGRSAEARVRIEPGARTATLDFEMPPPGPRLSGRVLLNGAPLSEAMVQAWSPPEPLGSTSTAFDGGFTLDLQRPGAVILLVGGPPGIGGSRTVQIEEDQEITLDLRTGRLRGAVTGPDGEPVENATLLLEGPVPGLDYPSFSLSLRTGPDGGFEVPRLGAGRVRISVSRPGFPPHQEMVDVPAGGEGMVEIRLRP